MPVPVDEILADYDRRAEELKTFAQRVERLVVDVLSGPVAVSQIQARVKGRGELHEKLLRETAEYQSLYDVTDVVGLRVITFFARDVDVVASVVTSEFTIDADNSVDKRAIIDPDRFGYLSLHYIVSLDPKRAANTEWTPFGKVPFEVQIRSLLQHTWAEIEHDLGYKTEQAIPRDARRRFSRLAGMLEIADSEFDGIRADLTAYQAELEERVIRAPAGLLIDQVSLARYVETDALVKSLDQEIASGRNARLELVPGYVARRSANLERLGLQTLGEMADALATNESFITEFADRWMRGRRYEALRRGISLYFLALVLLAQRGAPVELATALELGEDDRLRALGLWADLESTRPPTVG
jgi:putative GTP pyrophosphokinase